jgi:hypothetical protein
MNPLEYGKLIYKQKNVYTVQVSDTNIAIITQQDNNNLIKLYRKGDIIYEYKDIKINDSTFVKNMLILFIN